MRAHLYSKIIVPAWYRSSLLWRVETVQLNCVFLSEFVSLVFPFTLLRQYPYVRIEALLVLK